MKLLCVYVPETHLEQVKVAVFEAGAGRIGDYDSCCWQTAGTGQFRPLAASNPFLGERGKVERVSEFKVEMVVEDQLLESVVDAMLKAHPYEEPAYHVLQML